MYAAGVRAVRQLLDVVRRELKAIDAYIQLGGGELVDPKRVACELDAGIRLVARFETPPGDPEDARRRLQTVAEAFAQTVQESIDRVTSDVAVKRPALRRTLADALAALAEGSRATLALVIDTQSPVVWATSDSALEVGDIETAETLADDHARVTRLGLDPAVAGSDALEQTEDRELARSVARLRARFSDNPAAARRDVLAARAIAWARASAPPDATRHDPDLGVLYRRFSGIYRLVLAFDGPFSELVAEPITRRALPVIERLVAELPPLDPTPEGARVVPLRPK